MADNRPAENAEYSEGGKTYRFLKNKYGNYVWYEWPLPGETTPITSPKQAPYEIAQRATAATRGKPAPGEPTPDFTPIPDATGAAGRGAPGITPSPPTPTWLKKPAVVTNEKLMAAVGDNLGVLGSEVKDAIAYLLGAEEGALVDPMAFSGYTTGLPTTQTGWEGVVGKISDMLRQYVVGDDVQPEQGGGGVPGNAEGAWFTEDLTGGGGGGGAGNYPPGAYFDYLRAMEAPETFGMGDYMNFLRAQLPPGGPGTAGEFYGAVQSQMSPLSNLGGGIWDFITKMISPQTEMPNEYWAQLGKGVMPIETSLPGGFFSMLGQGMSSGYAEGTPPPPAIFGPMQAEAQSAVPFLAQMVQGSPDLAMAVIEALISMQQKAGEPYFPYLFGPAAEGMFGGGGGGGGFGGFGGGGGGGGGGYEPEEPTPDETWEYEDLRGGNPARDEATRRAVEAMLAGRARGRAPDAGFPPGRRP